MSHRSLLILLATSLVSYICYVRAEQNPYARYVASGYSVIDHWALAEVSDQELFEGAMNGMVDVLHKHDDQFSGFVCAENCEAFQKDMQQEFGGIGIRFHLLGSPPLPTVINTPLAGSPAHAAQIEAGDRIAQINGQATAEMSLEDVLLAIRGPVGEPVSLVVERSSEQPSQELEITREVIAVESVLGDIHDKQGNWVYRSGEDPRIGYLRIDQFGDKTAEEMTQILAEICSDTEETKAIEALILDVRDNSGGALESAVEICDMFLRAGLPIVTTRGRDSTIRERFVSTGGGGYTELPLAVLVNQNSASASEILAACLQDYQRATIIGQRTFGKGTVQRIIQTESGRSLLKLTSATYWRPCGTNIHRMPDASESEAWGVKPDPTSEIVLDQQGYEDWHKYRSWRDILGNDSGMTIVQQLERQYGSLPTDYRDESLKSAISTLADQLDN